MKPKKNKMMKPSPKKPVKDVSPEKPKTDESATPVKGKKSYNVLRGMHDILPKEEKYWKKYQQVAQKLAEYFQFGKIETPLVEEAGLFIRSVGRGTDIVDKEMYLFEDRDGSKVCLRPEPTASIVRAYIQHGMWNNAQPVKVWTWGPMFRHDRPQAGRYRQFFQADYEILGAKDPAIDAELILIAFNFYKDVGVPVTVHINSLGTPEDRERYIAELVSYYRSKRSYLCENCRLRITKNPLRLLDCKEEQCQPVKEGAPQIVDWLDESSKNYFMKVLEYLDEVEVPYVLTPTLVRGLDYYTHTVFELYPAFGEPGSQSALGGGGRYDLLVEDMGGKPTPAAGFGIGIERAILALREYQNIQKTELPNEVYDLYFAQLGDDAKRRGLKIIEDLRSSGLKMAFNFFKNSLKAQLEAANNFKVPYVLILGQKEVQDKTVIVRDMESGVQEIIDQKKLESVLRKKLSKGIVVEK